MDLSIHANKVPVAELARRIERFICAMDAEYEHWELCVITGAKSLYYLAGTVSDGVLLIWRDGNTELWARRGYDRAVLESELPDIRLMRSFRDIAAEIRVLPDTLYLDTAHATMEWYAMLHKYLPFKNVLPVDGVMMKTRSIKSEYELERLRLAGATIGRLFRDEFPSLIRDGISEAELGAGLYFLFMKNGHHGIVPFSMRNVNEVVGHIAFGSSSLFPSAFNGASGTPGLCAAVPSMGSRYRLLDAGDLIYIDVVFGVEGYNVDKTIVFSYKLPQPDHVTDAHTHCLELERLASRMLLPGAKPSEIYDEVIGSLRPEYSNCFMGAPGRAVPFIGHSVGMYVDEMPAIAKGFDDPLQPGMTIAIEPKIGIAGVGMVGSENTYLVTDEGGVSLTGTAADIIVIG